MRRRMNDFGGRTPRMLQVGTTTCCCCLHMVGAAIGAIGGLVTGMRRPADAPPMRPSARQAVNGGAIVGVLLLIVGIIILSIAGQTMDRLFVGEFFIAMIVFAPSTCALLIAATCLIAAGVEHVAHPREYDIATERGGTRYALRLGAHLIVWTSTLAGVGYLIMVAMAMFFG